ncbi:MAG: Gx transporter family protein [Clostridia bacterium]|nr:Gx transporter family protein [Clostridia bacterium]
MNKFNAKMIAYTAITLSAALIIGVIESLLPPVIPALPFLRLGLSNIVLIFALVALGAAPAFTIAFLKSVLVPLLVGNPIMIAYSLPAALLSLGATALLVYTRKFGLPTVSTVASLVHNMVQLCVASLMTGTALVFGYAPYLIFTGTLTGLAVGFAAYLILRFFPKKLLEN